LGRKRRDAGADQVADLAGRGERELLGVDLALGEPLALDLDVRVVGLELLLDRAPELVFGILEQTVEDDRDRQAATGRRRGGRGGGGRLGGLSGGGGRRRGLGGRWRLTAGRTEQGHAADREKLPSGPRAPDHPVLLRAACSTRSMTSRLAPVNRRV